MITKRKVILRLRKSLIGSFAVPFDGFCKIFFYTIASGIENPKCKLRLIISLFSSFA